MSDARAIRGVHALSHQMESMPYLGQTLQNAQRGIVKSLHALQIGDAGSVPLLVKMLSLGSPEAQDCAAGALANLSANPRCRELIADAHGIPPLICLLGMDDIGEGIREIAVGTLTNLAILPANQVTSNL